MGAVVAVAAARSVWFPDKFLFGSKGAEGLLAVGLFVAWWTVSSSSVMAGNDTKRQQSATAAAVGGGGGGGS
jgi:hypothetical protein